MNMVSGIGVTSGWLLQLVGCGAGSGADVDQGKGNPVETQAEAALGNALSPAQEKTALGLIDQICADTWCSGDYDFGFRRLSCSRASETCTLTLQAFPREELPSQWSYSRSCETSDFTGFRSLVNQEESGYQSLDEAYYDALTECTTRIVNDLP
jgi:hypothetical protein